MQDDVARMLAAGSAPRCPHPDEPAFCFLPSGMVACGPCTDQLIETAGGASNCHVCGAPAFALAAWVTGGVACVAGLCEQCHSAGLVPLAPN